MNKLCLMSLDLRPRMVLVTLHTPHARAVERQACGLLVPRPVSHQRRASVVAMQSSKEASG